MKTPITLRIVTLVAAASTTFALLQSVALIGHPVQPPATVVLAERSAH